MKNNSIDVFERGDNLLQNGVINFAFKCMLIRIAKLKFTQINEKPTFLKGLGT